MSPPPTPTGAPPGHDVRLRGFADLATLVRAHEWVDRQPAPLAAEEIAVDACVGRVLAAPLVAAADHPGAAQAGIDGYAARAAETVGASAYDPVSLGLQGEAERLAPASAALVSAGDALPPGADAVLGFDAAQPAGPSTLEVIAPTAPGAGVDRAGQQVRAGAPLVRPGHPLGPREAALLAALGLHRIQAVARPLVRILVAGPKAAAAPDAHGPMLRALVLRDGGTVDALEVGGDLQGALRRAAGAADLILVTGRTGTGQDDVAALALAGAGEVALHGIALRPGSSAGLGHAGQAPVVLLPGDPLACLVAYEHLAGRLLRLLAGRDPALPYPTREAELRRKIVSAVGFVEVCQVRLLDGGAEPLGVAEFGGLAAAARADGFVVVPAPLEGYAPGARVTVHLYGS